MWTEGQSRLRKKYLKNDGAWVQLSICLYVFMCMRNTLSSYHCTRELYMHSYYPEAAFTGANIWQNNTTGICIVLLLWQFVTLILSSCDCLFYKTLLNVTELLIMNKRQRLILFVTKLHARNSAWKENVVQSFGFDLEHIWLTYKIESSAVNIIHFIWILQICSTEIFL